MTEDVFRIVVSVAVALTAVAFVVQAGVVIASYRGFRATQQKVNQWIGKAAPVLARAQLAIDKTGPILEKIGPTIDRIMPVIDKLSLTAEKIGPLVHKTGLMVDDVATVVRTSNRILEETRPQIVEFTSDTAAIARSGREQVERLGALLHDAGERAQNRLEQIDRTVQNTVEQIEHAGDSVKRSMLAPVKGVNGLAAGISAAVSTLVHGSRKSSVDSATQDEEMFI
jgi:hypothetical protein